MPTDGCSTRDTDWPLRVQTMSPQESVGSRGGPSRVPVLQALVALCLLPPAVVRAFWNTWLLQHLALRTGRRVHFEQQAGLLTGAHPLVPVADSGNGAATFFKRNTSDDSSATNCLRSAFSRLSCSISYWVASRTVSRLSLCLPASRNSFVHE